jgi:hypothetical protein
MLSVVMLSVLASKSQSCKQSTKVIAVIAAKATESTAFTFNTHLMLAYFAAAISYDRKIIIILALGVNAIKPFFLSLLVQTNKLECLSLESVSSLV